MVFVCHWFLFAYPRPGIELAENPPPDPPRRGDSTAAPPHVDAPTPLHKLLGNVANSGELPEVLPSRHC